MSAAHSTQLPDAVWKPIPNPAYRSAIMHPATTLRSTASYVFQLDWIYMLARRFLGVEPSKAVKTCA